MEQDILKNPVIREDMESIYASGDFRKLLQGKRIYITGAAGMIASYLTYFLIYLNEVYNYNLHIYGGIRSKEKAEKRFGFYCGKDYFHIISEDVSTPCRLADTMDYIIHAASLASPQYYGKMPVETMAPNIIGTYELLKYAAENQTKGFLFLSSGNVYGTVTNTEVIDEKTIGSFDFLADGNVYGESKRCGEALCSAFFREYQVPSSIVRVHHTYGPTMDIARDNRVFAEFMNNVVNSQNIVMKSDGSARRAFCYVTDTVSALLAVLLKGERGKVYNVGNPREYMSVGELAHMLVELAPDSGAQVIMEKRETGADYQPSKEKRSGVLSTQALEGLGWQPQISAREGFGRCLTYFTGKCSP